MQTGQRKRVAVFVHEFGVGGYRRGKLVAGAATRPERPQSMGGVVHDRHAETLGRSGDIDGAISA